MAPRWNCECCCEDFNDYTSIDIQGCPVCPGCVRTMFDKALKFEHEYPPDWSGPLHPREFSHIFSKTYIERYEHKEIEYKTQPGRRVYCQHMIPRPVSGDGVLPEFSQEPCGEFIGVRQKMSKPDMLLLGRCKACSYSTCMVCDAYTTDPAAILQHVCPGRSTANEKRALAFAGLKRGRDWQQCPSRSCGRRIELSAACNHMSCQCGTGFCFICGKEADGDSDHWARKSGCPRYNHPDDLDAEYDDPYDDDDDDYVAPLRDELEASDNDPLENVRGLFEVDEDDETEVPELTTAMDEEQVQTGGGEHTETIVPVLATNPNEEQAQTGDGTSLDEVSLQPVVTRLLHTLDRVRVELSIAARIRAAAEGTTEAEARAATRDEAAVHLAGPVMQETITHTEETNDVSAHDVEAIRDAYFEDDLSDGEHDAYELLGHSDGPAVTMEEAEIDRALWKMRVD